MEPPGKHETPGRHRSEKKKGARPPPGNCVPLMTLRSPPSHVEKNKNPRGSRLFCMHNHALTRCFQDEQSFHHTVEEKEALKRGEAE